MTVRLGAWVPRGVATAGVSCLVALAALTAAPGPRARGQGGPSDDPAVRKARRPDVVYLPTPPEVVDRMLAVAGVTPDDLVYDLGCGDGRIVVAAASRYGARAVGIDIDPRRVREARQNASRAGVEDLVTVIEGDAFAADISKATVVTLYLLPNLNARLMPKLARLRPGTRVVSHSFVLGKARPARVEKVRLANGGVRTVYLWVIPWDEGTGR